MSEWPDKLEITAEQFDSMSSDALFEWMAPWLSGIRDSEKMPEPLVQTALGYFLFADVANGGLEQFLTNSPQALRPSATALRSLGLELAAAMLEKAADQLPEDFAGWDGDKRWDFASESYQITEMSDPFWASLTRDEFTDSLATFARKHKDAFAPYFCDGPPVR
jgi:hypothetical protein